MARGPKGVVGIEPAKSDRSHCKRCKDSIVEGDPRLIYQEPTAPWMRNAFRTYFLCQKCGLKLLKEEKKNLKGLIKRIKNGFVCSRSLQNQG